ncbi:TPM domain-containing protein [Rhodoferax sp.]|uniref:TPM domain-containing protein n=1 Tax=Rhodoferax sp. TaxID=50421 RepID=UPI00260BD9A4|nr:TPM domain-containing protein [Rhodoferax sp.]MDD2926246.1 TPM domain-containing protein [Rhodoferax sp.]
MLTKLKRLFRHRWLDERAAARAIPPALLAQLTRSVQSSEQRHSGEIRICVEAGLPLSYLWRNSPMSEISRMRALSMFGKLRVWDTAHNNGVLIYLLLAEQAIEIVADRGLNDKVPTATWQALLNDMRGPFQRGEYELGLNLAVKQVSDLLTTHFPLVAGESNPNELPDAPLLR